MCGICGWLNLKNQLDINTFINMNNIVKHRGPDDEGYLSISDNGCMSMYGEDSCKDFKYDKKVSDCNIKSEETFLLLGHRRLSIIDLSVNGHQPMVSSDKSLHITFNGEIYNYIEIREELLKKGSVFETQTDTEVILKAYEVWGEECVNHFNGMWGFAIWDSKKNKLFCSRDRLGAKPFYYYTNENEFMFSSEIKQICENPNVNKVLNESVFVSQIMWNITDYSEDTLIQGINALQGGWNIVITLNEDNTLIEKIKKYQFWDIDTSMKDDTDENTVFTVLEDAIHLRTRSDAPIGVLLSGGLDSSCIVAEIAEYYEKKGLQRNSLNTFTSCYNDFDAGNEQKFAQMVNEHCQTTQNFIYPDDLDTFELLEQAVWHLEGSMNFSILGSYQLLREISKTGIKVLINGQGSDETQFGYERYYAYYLKDLLKSIKFKKFIQEFHKARNNSRLTKMILFQYFIYFTFANIRKVNCLKRMNIYVTKATKRKFKENTGVLDYINPKDMQSLQFNEIRGTQLPHILRMDDRLYMSHSLESRVPYIDYRYIEAAVRIPESKKIQNGYTKYLLRKHFENKLPKEIIWRKNKMGWPSPKDRWARRFNEDKINELFETAKTAKYFNLDNLRLLYKNDPAAYPIEQFLVAELFVRKFNVEIPEED